ncbi:unnamed protein product [Cyprideis torosa]|uniref:Uncharacterized protein n=1 Tax=Cyprideis torosa TaxID=163714 RepID=A0A7R8WJ91_9CRUS|nr:unnamed protein product [Cyprideis torosa]CAG0901716.1 unnamed protein product [Cyprideis torosa]
MKFLVLAMLVAVASATVAPADQDTSEAVYTTSYAAPYFRSAAYVPTYAAAPAYGYARSFDYAPYVAPSYVAPSYNYGYRTFGYAGYPYAYRSAYVY